MLVEIGEVIHVIERRLFDTDVRRHFCGVVELIDASAVRVRGYVFTYDSATSQYVRSDRERTHIFPLGASGFIINVAPPETVVEDVSYVVTDTGRLIVTDERSFSLDINQFGRSR